MLNVLDAHTTHLAQETERPTASELHASAVKSLTALVAELDDFHTCHHVANSETGEAFSRSQELARQSLNLVSAMHAAYNAMQIAAPDIAGRGVQSPDKQNAGKGQYNDGLTSREMETLVLVARGMVAKEIARALTISEKTVRNHLGNIYRKLDIYDRSQVVIYAMKKGLVHLNEV